MRLFLSIFLFILISIKSEGQTLFTKCIQSCTPAGTQKGVIDQHILDSTSDIIIAGYGAINFQGYYISKNDSLNNLVWSSEFQWAIHDTLFGITDTVYQRKRSLYKTERFHENNILFVLEQDSVIYKIVNSAITFERIGLKSSILGMVDINGNLLWSSIVNFDKHNRLRHISVSDDQIYFGGIYSENYFQSNAQGNQIFICTDTSGAILWNILIPNSSSRTIVKTINYLDNGILVLSNDSTSTYLMKIENNGNIIWSYNYSSNFKLNGIDLTVSNDSTIAILANNDPSPNKSCLLKIDSLGNLIWTNSYNSNLNLYPKQLIRSHSDTVIVIMEQYGSSPRKVVSLNVYPNGVVSNGNVFYENTSYSSNNPPSSSFNYLQTVNRQGSNYIGNIDGGHDFPIVGVHAEYVNTIRFNESMNSCSFNNYSTIISNIGLIINKDSLISSDSSTTIATSVYALFLQSANYPIVNSCIINVGLDAFNSPNVCGIFPNPTNGNFTLRIPMNIMNCHLSVYNQSGQLVYQMAENNVGELVTINLPQMLASGVYELRAILDENLVHSKLILIKN